MSHLPPQKYSDGPEWDCVTEGEGYRRGELQERKRGRVREMGLAGEGWFRSIGCWRGRVWEVDGEGGYRRGFALEEGLREGGYRRGSYESGGCIIEVGYRREGSINGRVHIRGGV